MDKMGLIEQIARMRTVEQMVRNITHSTADTLQDLSQMVYEALLMTPDDRIIELGEQGPSAVNCYIAAIIRNQYFSDSSRYHYDFRRLVLTDGQVQGAEDTSEE